MNTIEPPSLALQHYHIVLLLIHIVYGHGNVSFEMYSSFTLRWWKPMSPSHPQELGDNQLSLL